MEADWRYGHVEAALARLHNVPNEGLKKFRARIRHLRNAGVPELPQAGSGTHITYTADRVAELFVGLELLHNLWSPAGIRKWFLMSREDVRLSCRQAIADPSAGYCIGVCPMIFEFRGEKETGYWEHHGSIDGLLEVIKRDVTKGSLPHLTIIALSPRLPLLHKYIEEALP